jgi:predicted RNase H-like nuclease
MSASASRPPADPGGHIPEAPEIPQHGMHRDIDVPRKQSRSPGLVLGIDAAWTRGGSSGVALLRAEGGVRRILAVAPSYAAFIELGAGTQVTWARAPGTEANAAALLYAAERLGGDRVDVVAVDMPLAHAAITGRRKADDVVSSSFGRFKAAVHSPTAGRPGDVGRALGSGFVAAGFPLATHGTPPEGPALIEVYPLAALVHLLCERERPRYKVGKVTRHWPALDRAGRIAALLAMWQRILQALAVEIDEREIPFPQCDSVATLAELKPFEDGLDAVICAWIGACFLAGETRPHGDDDAAIWVPLPSDPEWPYQEDRSAAKRDRT